LLFLLAGHESFADADRPCENLTDFWFPVGEELIYRIYWGIIPVGRTHVVTEWIREDGKRLLAIRYRTRSNKVIAKIYPVDDLIEAIIDPETFRPVRFRKKLSEGRHRSDEVTTFDYDCLRARWESKTKNQVKEYEIEPDTRDLVSFMYHMRSENFHPGEVRDFRVMADEKIYDLSVKVRAKETVKLPRFGEVRSLRLEPEAKFQGLFVRSGRMVLWVSQDERRLCTKVTVVVPVASVRVLLDQVRGPGDDFWTSRTSGTER